MGTKIYRFLMVVALAVLTGACASVSDGPGKPQQLVEPVVGDRMLEHMAAIDLVNTMMQVPHLHPSSATPIEMNRPQFGFGKQLHDVLKLAGYNVQIIGEKSAEAFFLKYSQGAESTGTTYGMEVNDFKVRRTYAIVENKVTPRSPVFVYGVDPSLIEANDGIFARPVKSVETGAAAS